MRKVLRIVNGLRQLFNDPARFDDADWHRWSLRVPTVHVNGVA